MTHHCMRLLLSLGPACVSLLLSACGGEEGPAVPQPPAARSAERPAARPASGDAGLPNLVVQAASGPTDELQHALLTTRAPTDELVAPLLGPLDPKVLSLLEGLRTECLRRENDGWPTLDGPPAFRAEPRCCALEALRSRRGVMVEVYHSNLPTDLAERHADGTAFSPLKTSKAEFLATSRDGGYLRGSHGPIALRGGETARLSVGWTRARLNAREQEGRIVASYCADAFNGLRISISSHVTGGEQGTWGLSAFVSMGGLRDDKAADLYGQSSEASHVEATTAVRLALSTKEAAWLVRAKPFWEASETQVLICARVADL